MTRVLVTGGSGFIGARVLAHLLDQGNDVAGLFRTRPVHPPDEVKPVIGDILTGQGLAAAVQEAAPELCIHLAWYTAPRDYLASVHNDEWMTGSLKLLAALDAADCPRTIMAGTCLEYAPADGEITETMRLSPATAYASAKAELMRRATIFQARAGRTLAWPRIFYLYGPGEKPERLVPTVVNRLLAGQPCPLTLGTQVRDYLHVDDVAAALVAVAASAIEGPVNVGSGEGVAVSEVARLIGEIIGRPDLLRFGEIAQPAGDPASVVADSGLLRGATGWYPVLDLPRGLMETVRWWRTGDALRNPSSS